MSCIFEGIPIHNSKNIYIHVQQRNLVGLRSTQNCLRKVFTSLLVKLARSQNPNLKA